ncbi:DSBA oxidoreductase [Thermus thermophilus]|nr:DSBA oxidoreductase [Thermus thermophilus]
MVVRVFSDFQCPYCQRLAREVLPALKAMAREGRLRLAYRHFPLYEIHPEAVPAAVASECAAAQGAFWAYHDFLMAGSGRDYLALAGRLGLDPKAFQACLEDPASRAPVEADRALAERLGLPGTPSVFVGPFRLPNPFDLERYRDYLALAEAL